jgi:hypothetical protein
MAAHSDDLTEMLAHGFLLATQQEAPPSVMHELVTLFSEAAAAYRRDPAEAHKLAENPETAALVLVANTILNLDSALTR